MKEQLNFEVNLPSVIRFYIQKYYEKICKCEIPHDYVNKIFYDEEVEEMIHYQEDLKEDTFEQHQMMAEVYALFELINEFNNKKDEDIEKDFEDFILQNYPVKDNEIFIKKEHLERYASYQYEKYKKTEQYKYERTRLAKKYHKSYVYDAYTDTFAYVKFGHHFEAVRKFVIHYLLQKDDLTNEQRIALQLQFIPVELYPQADEYIENFIQLKGTFNSPETYKLDKYHY